jgi:uncharacterized protein
LLNSSKYRGIKGGLDNAVKQAEERQLYKLDIADCDAHQMEPFLSFAKYCPESVRKLILSPDPEVDPELAKSLARTKDKNRSGTFMQTKQGRIEALKRPETSYPYWEEKDEIVDLFTRRMHDIGIQRSIVFPTALLSYPFMKPEIGVAVVTAYMEYMLENFLGKYPEISTPLVVPTNSPSASAEMIDRLGSEKGVSGVMICANSRQLAGSEDWNPIYEAAQSKDLPVCFHAGREMSTFDRIPFLGAHALGLPFGLVRQLTSLLLSGVHIRFKKVKFVFIEGGVTWIPWLMHRLDDDFVKRSLEAPMLSKLPSEYMKEFYYSSQPLEQAHIEELEPIFKMCNFENNLMYASDYPHWDFDAPSVIYDLPFLSETAKKKIMGDNARKVFKKLE